jgi:hypothetical protein
MSSTRDDADIDLERAWTEHVKIAREAWPTLTWDVATYRAWLVDACGG